MGWLIGPWLETLAWTEVRVVSSFRRRLGLHMLAAIALWVVHSKGGGQLISCHTCAHILDFCVITFGFLVTPPALCSVQTLCLAPKPGRGMWKYQRCCFNPDENVWRYPQATLVSPYISFTSLQPNIFHLSVLYSQMAVGKEFIVFSKWNKLCHEGREFMNGCHKKLHGNNICLTSTGSRETNSNDNEQESYSSTTV